MEEHTGWTIFGVALTICLSLLACFAIKKDSENKAAFLRAGMEQVMLPDTASVRWQKAHADTVWVRIP